MQASSKLVKVLAQFAERVNWWRPPGIRYRVTPWAAECRCSSANLLFILFVPLLVGGEVALPVGFYFLIICAFTLKFRISRHWQHIFCLPSESFQNPPSRVWRVFPHREHCVFLFSLFISFVPYNLVGYKYSIYRLIKIVYTFCKIFWEKVKIAYYLDIALLSATQNSPPRPW